jgi:AbrB family looped-hinge helix DNA binding protein
MNTTTLSSKGQIVIPKAIREAYAWPVGMPFLVLDTPAGILLKPKPAFPPTTLDAVAGCLAFTGEAQTVAEMDTAVVQARQKQTGEAPDGRP